MTTKTLTSKFYTFNQNNSGGRWHENKNLSHTVSIEAFSAEEANARAEALGIYFDGSDDCECCGNRWNEVDEKDGYEVPSFYEGDPIKTGGDDAPRRAWTYRSYRIHHLDGTIEKES